MIKTQKGFTLVELAIALVIIGLLLAGILKGRELITSAQLNMTASQTKSLTAALITFHDMQRGMPGDLTAPTTRLTNCANQCAVAGNGDGRIGNAAEVALARSLSPAPESLVAWAQMSTMNLISGTLPEVTALEFGNSDPAAAIGGGYVISYLGTPVFPLPYITATQPRDGHYLALVSRADGIQVTTTTMTPPVAERLDRKIDDGKPNTGGMVAIGIALAGSQQCATSTAASGLYASTVSNENCGAFIRMRD
ncbi:MAG: prepilin-type N-terminal cleavage/methylation domain-containing protein [Pseudomonadota bacterium]